MAMHYKLPCLIFFYLLHDCEGQYDYDSYIYFNETFNTYEVLIGILVGIFVGIILISVALYCCCTALQKRIRMPGVVGDENEAADNNNDSTKIFPWIVYPIQSSDAEQNKGMQYWVPGPPNT
ncbi:uncharacterized protein LOC134282639 [Saccostrea cucullata]|uniref:uncharacterized protein LOC134282639 n=1 Tax=Saccostrea cuccullata TaxID=36930 RepID=UPI002ED324BA